MSIPTPDLSILHNCCNNFYGYCETKKNMHPNFVLSAFFEIQVEVQSQDTVDSFKANSLISVYSLNWKITSVKLDFFLGRGFFLISRHSR